MRTYTFTVIAEAVGPFVDFAPYVAAIDDRGGVTFQATLADGGTGVWTGDGGSLTTVFTAPADGVRAVRSHPVRTTDGTVYVYADGDDGEALLRIVEGRATRIGTFTRVGPLGPTTNAAGQVAFRAGAGVFRTTGDHIVQIADGATFHGLPVLRDDGAVVFRADREGTSGIYLGDGDTLRTLVDTWGPFAALGLFPSADHDSVAFAAMLRGGGSGVFVVRAGRVVAIADTTDGFESFRGALIDGEGRVVFFATPVGGELGVYAGGERLIGVGDTRFGAPVTELALNPVSINAGGQLAIRLRLADGRQVVARADRHPV